MSGSDGRQRTEASRPVGVIVPGPGARRSVAGVPIGDRAALVLRRAGCERVLAVAGPDASVPLGPRARWVEPAVEPPLEGHVVLVLGDVVFDRPLVEKLCAARNGVPAVARAETGFVLAAEAPLARAVARAHGSAGLAGALRELPAESVSVAPDMLLPASSGLERSAATRALLRATGKAADGLLTRIFERRISQAISRALLPLPISPNMVTTVSLAIGLASACLLATTEWGTRVVGAALFVLATIVDGCDGEIARAKLLESSVGKLYDTAVDIVVNAAVFLGIGVGVWHEFQGVPDVRVATILLVAGGLLAMAAVETVRRLVPSPPPDTLLARVRAWGETFATLEWSYVVLALSLAGQLPFFFWGAAVGTNAFSAIYILLGVLSAIAPRDGVADRA